MAGLTAPMPAAVCTSILLLHPIPRKRSRCRQTIMFMLASAIAFAPISEFGFILMYFIPVTATGRSYLFRKKKYLAVLGLETSDI